MVKQTRTELELNDIEILIEMLEEFKDGSYSFVPPFLTWEDTEIKLVDEETLGSGRWTEHMLTIVEFRGKLYGIEWESGLTEMQESEFYPDKSTVYEVDKIEKVVYTYKKKSQGASRVGVTAIDVDGPADFDLS